MINFKLMNHQAEALSLSRIEPNIFFALEQGTGKTCVTIQIVREKYAEAGRVMRTLILAPAVVMKNWKNEFKMFSKIDQNMIHVLDGPVKKRIAAIEAQKGYSAIFITNYDVMQGPEICKAFKDWGVEILIADESHYLKSYKSKRAKNVALLAQTCKHRYLLTGTPILNNAMDLFQQYYILDGYKGKDSTLGTNFFAFRAQYFFDKNASWSSKPNYYPEWVPRHAAYECLMRQISRVTMRVLKKDCLDLPDLVTQDYTVELGKDQAKLYREMKDEFITWIDSERGKGTKEAVVARLAVVKALRLQQIVSGFVKTDTGEVIRIKDNPRMSALRELLEVITPGNKVIVWACFKENISMIRELCEELKIKSCEIHGDNSTKEKNEAVRAFKEDTEVRVCISNPAAGGVGISLVQASYSIYFSRNFKLSDDLQSEARNHRRGSEIHDKITRINLVCPGTIDGLVADALQRKLDISDKIVGRLSEI